jgi:hypothetical protein
MFATEQGWSAAAAAATRLRKEYSIMGDIPVLLSTERPRCSLVSLVDTAGVDLRDYQVGPLGVRTTWLVLWCMRVASDM